MFITQVLANRRPGPPHQRLRERIRLGLSGIYRCALCGHEIVCKAGEPFPSGSHLHHKPIDGPPNWHLIVMAESKLPEGFPLEGDSKELVSD